MLALKENKWAKRFNSSEARKESGSWLNPCSELVQKYDTLEISRDEFKAIITQHQELIKLVFYYRNISWVDLIDDSSLQITLTD